MSMRSPRRRISSLNFGREYFSVDTTVNLHWTVGLDFSGPIRIGLIRTPAIRMWVR
jgi:hypothetical protein